MKIVCVGEATVDQYLTLNQQFVGGISLNFAVHTKRCGAEQLCSFSAAASRGRG